MSAATSPLLELRNLSVHFPIRRCWFRAPSEYVRAVDGVSLEVAPGETLGLVGESGCGKTTLGRAVVRLVDPTGGSIFFENEDILALQGKTLRARRRRFQMVFQNPYASLNPRLTVDRILAEPLDIHGLNLDRASRQRRVQSLLDAVGLDSSHGRRYPHEFSGGQRQRIGIARALAVEPRLIVCDEPISALDVSVQAQIINLLHDLQQDRAVAYLFIAHDLAVVEHLSHRIAVMYLGRLMETGPAKTVCRDPLHPYTQALLAAAPRLRSTAAPRAPLPGDPPSPIHPPSGCPFHTRCPLAETRCREETPALRPVAPQRAVACHLVGSSIN